MLLIDNKLYVKIQKGLSYLLCGGSWDFLWADSDSIWKSCGV